MKRIKMEDFQEIKSLSRLRCSPDGSRAAFVVSQPRLEENRYECCIHVWENGAVRRLTTGGRERELAWLDNDTLVFPVAGGKQAEGTRQTVLHRISLHGGEAAPWVTLPFALNDVLPLDEDTFLCRALCDNNVPGDNVPEECLVFDELPFWKDGKGVTNKLRHRVCLCHGSTGEYTFLTPPLMEAKNLAYSEALGLALTYGSEYDKMDDHRSCLYVMDVQTGESRKLDLGRRYYVTLAQFVGDHIVVAGSSGEDYGFTENPKFYRVDPVTGAMELLAAPDASLGNALCSDCQYGGGMLDQGGREDLYFVDNRGSDSCIVRMDARGQTHRVTPDRPGTVELFDRAGDVFYYVSFTEAGLHELYCCREGGPETCLTAFNRDYLREHSVITPRYLPFTDKAGTEIEGWVLEPAGYDPRKSYPGMLMVHGGPRCFYSPVFHHEQQLWANEGYFLFFCNPRGGSGRGNEFADIRGARWGDWDYSDLMEFTDLVLETYPQIDRARLGMTGGSYGGFMANWINGHTDRFAALSAQRSISNYVSKCLTTDIGYFHNMTAMGATPWTNIDQFWNVSPLKYADRAKTPTLFLHSDEDYRCWLAEPLQMMTALQLHHVETRMVLFHGESHGLSGKGKPSRRLRRFRELLTWFDHYLKPEP